MRWTKEKDPLAPKSATTPRGVLLFPLVGLFAILFTFGSFFLFDERDGTGDLSRAVSQFEDFFSENEAIAVFLGWEGK